MSLKTSSQGVLSFSKVTETSLVHLAWHLMPCAALYLLSLVLGIDPERVTTPPLEMGHDCPQWGISPLGCRPGSLMEWQICRSVPRKNTQQQKNFC